MRKRILLSTLITSVCFNATGAFAQEKPTEMPFNMVSVSKASNLPVSTPSPDKPILPSKLPTSDANASNEKISGGLALPPLAGFGSSLNKPDKTNEPKKIPEGVGLQEQEMKEAIKVLEPVNSTMIEEFRKVQQDNSEAQTRPVGEANNMVSRSLSMDLRAGSKPPTIHLATGMATALTFSGLTGAQWPVLSVTTGNPTMYTPIEAGEKGKGNMVVISPLTAAGKSNLVVTLLNLPVPLIFNLETGHGNVDGRLDINIKKMGPNDHVDMAQGSTLGATNDETVQNFIDGLPPKGAKKLPSSDADVEAWKYNNLLYIRTPYAILSPAYIGKANNISGDNVYTMSGNTPIILVEQDGRMREVTLSR